MAFDGFMMAAVKRELEDTLTGGRIEKIYQPLAREVVLVVRSERTRYRLLISADAQEARIHLTATVRENPQTPPMFCMVLRKHLEGSKILGFKQQGLERVLVIRVEATDETGFRSDKHLVCEVMGKHSNIILLDPVSDTILDGINRYSYGTSRHREVLPGRRYVSPPESGKLDPLTTTESEFRSVLWDPDLDIPTEQMILNRFMGISPQTCRELTARAGLEPGLSSQSIGELELTRLWQAFSSLRDSAAAGLFQPTVCYRGKTPAAFSFTTLTHLPELSCHTGQPSTVADEYYSTRDLQRCFALAAADLIKLVRQEAKKAGKKLAIHRETLRRGEAAEMLKITGELITANIHTMAARSSSADLVNYYDPAGGSITVELDPRLTPAENAQAYFKRYTKARHGKTLAEKYLSETEAELTYLESVLLALEQAEEMSDLNEIRAELTKEGFIKTRVKPGGAKKDLPNAEPKPMKFSADAGFEILVGRNNRQNDYLTLRLAQPGDTWLHVKDIPGSHVIIRNPLGTAIPSGVLQQAAETAAYYSRGRQSSKVPVDYTEVRNVRKPRGAKPGMVIYDHQRTVIVEPKISP